MKKGKLFLSMLIFFMLLTTSAVKVYALDGPSAGGLDWGKIGTGIVETVIYFVIGIIAQLVGFKLLDKFTSDMDLQKEISGENEPDKKGNIAAGILAGCFSIAIAIIVAASIL